MVSYKDAGVDISAGNELVKKLKKLCPDIGGFGGLYPLGNDYLVAGTDGVGTKLKLAFAEDRHSTIGIDLVAMCVNDIITMGARPLFFLDYFATSKLSVPQAEQVLKGILHGCQEAGCVLLGGETAEMPGFYQDGEYDLSGFAVGIVPKNDLTDGSTIVSGDLLVGMPSSGLHSNGFSLVRKVLNNSQEAPSDLLEPTKIYVKDVQSIQAKYQIKGMAHITGGGLLENIPRIFPEGLGASIEKKAWVAPPIFDWLQSEGNIDEMEMYRTFNMGIGMVLVVSSAVAETICGEHPAYSIIGKVIEGKGVAIL
ncbi:MAG: phosphoribosylformylglycinamidine cyclo-ligase [Waddliaceae bacterium]